MLKVIIAGPDGSHTGIFETDDRKEAAEKALECMVENHGFFPLNLIHTTYPSDFIPPKGAYGMLVMPSDAIDIPANLEDKIHDDNTIWVYVIQPEFNQMLWD